PSRPARRSCRRPSPASAWSTGKERKPSRRPEPGARLEKKALHPFGNRALATHANRSADRQRIQQAAVFPERVQATLDLQRAAHAHVAVKRFAVVAHLLDDAVSPL